MENLAPYYAADYYSFIPPAITPCPANTPPRAEALLDVGCGNGAWLCAAAGEGYTSLTGCDPFIAGDLAYENGVRIYKRIIHEMEGSFDFIHFGDSFEHVADPLEDPLRCEALFKAERGMPDGASGVSKPRV